MVISDRVRTALASRATATNDFFGGWDEGDVELLERWAVDPSTLQPEPGVLVDWLGGRTMLANHAWLPAPAEGVVICDIPIPDDCVHGEAIEYVAMLSSIEMARRRHDTYTMFELGASYSPWAGSAGIVALRAGFRAVSLVSVEASADTIPRIEEHFRLNGLSDRPEVTTRIVHAAVAARRGTLHFPRVDTRSDNGAAVTSSPRRTDYRGVPVTYDKVRAIRFDDLADGVGEIDFVHLDLQGAEEQLVTDRRFLRTVTGKVACLMLATQSRLIEGLALRELSKLGWRLQRERPTTYAQNDRTDDINGWTLRDGAQFWVNPRFV